VSGPRNASRPKLTPTNILSYTLFFGGVAMLIASRFVEADRTSLSGIALLLIAAGLFAEALLPGSQEFTDEQIVAIRHARLPYRRGMEKWTNGLVGTAALAGALYLLS
jgi:hypothetical protein